MAALSDPDPPGAPDPSTAHRATQARLYGAPLAEVLGRCGRVLGCSQARLAELLGISAPMLSQLMLARRVKIGNPAAVQRLQLMNELVGEVEAGGLAREEAVARLDRNRRDNDVFTAVTPRGAPAAAPPELDAARWRAAAERVGESDPEVAAYLRSLGGDPPEVNGR